MYSLYTYVNQSHHMAYRRTDETPVLSYNIKAKTTNSLLFTTMKTNEQTKATIHLNDDDWRPNLSISGQSIIDKDFAVCRSFYH